MERFRCITVRQCKNDSIEVDGVMFDGPYANHRKTSPLQTGREITEEHRYGDMKEIEPTLDNSPGTVLLTKQELERHLNNARSAEAMRRAGHQMTTEEASTTLEKKKRIWSILGRRSNSKDTTKQQPQQQQQQQYERIRKSPDVVPLHHVLGISPEDGGTECSLKTLKVVEPGATRPIEWRDHPGRKREARRKARIASLKEKELERQRQLQGRSPSKNQREPKPEQAPSPEPEQQAQLQQQLSMMMLQSPIAASLVPLCTQELGQTLGWVWCTANPYPEVTEEGEECRYDDTDDDNWDGESKLDDTVVMSNKYHPEPLAFTPPSTIPVTLLDACVECGKEERTHIAMPCMHFSFCKRCVKRLHEQYQDTPIYCPVCQSKDVAFTRVKFGKDQQAPERRKTEMIWL
jgi:hypothetical protein